MDLNEIKAINTKMEQVLKGVSEIQKTADEAVQKCGTIDTETKAALEKMQADASTTAGELQELKQKATAAEKTGEYIEKMLSRMPGAAGAEQSEIEQQAKEETTRYLRTGRLMSDKTVEAVVTAMVGKSMHGLSEDDRASEIKSLIAGSGPDGGYFIRPERSATMIGRIFETSPMRSVAAIDTTSTSAIEYVIDDDESTSGGWTGETDARSDTATPKVGLLTIPAHEQYAQPKATQKMLDDAGFDIEAWLARKTADKLSRTENTAFVVGDGSQKPRGFLNLPAWAAAGVYERFKLEQINSGAAAALTGDGLKKLQNAVKEAYQNGSIWAMKRGTWGAVILLKDGAGNYLLPPNSLTGLKEKDDLVLLSRPVRFFDDMPVVQANSLSVAYGNFGVGYTIVDRIGFRVIRDNVTQKPYIKFYTTKRTGGDVTNYEAIKIQKTAS